MRTLRVRELCRHDRDMSPVNNQLQNLDAHIGSYIFFEDLYRSNSIAIYVVPFVIGMLLARDLIVGISIPSSISLPASLFTRSVMLHPVTNSLATLLARLIVMYITEMAQIYLFDNRSHKSQDWSMPTQQIPSETHVEHLYNHPVTLWRLIAHKLFFRYKSWRKQ